MVSHASQQQTRIIFMFGAEPERAAVVQHKLPEPLYKRFVLDASEQPAHSGGIAYHARLNALGKPRTAHSLTPPVPPLDAVFTGYILGFVMVR